MFLIGQNMQIPDVLVLIGFTNKYYGKRWKSKKDDAKRKETRNESW